VGRDYFIQFQNYEKHKRLKKKNWKKKKRLNADYESVICSSSSSNQKRFFFLVQQNNGKLEKIHNLNQEMENWERNSMGLHTLAQKLTSQKTQHLRLKLCGSE
jgi:hypothetical protein